MNDTTSSDENTIDKVRQAIRRFDPFADDEAITGLISEIQNEGILFRERPELKEIVHAHGDHGWHQHTAEEYAAHPQPVDGEKGPHPVLGGHPAQLTDGFHTMEELYDHRRALTAVLATLASFEGDAWRSKAHHPDDDPMFEGGYFIVGIKLPTGTITYHYKLTHWDDFAATPEVEHAPKWDGAGPMQTIDRLLELARGVADPNWVPTEQ